MNKTRLGTTLLLALGLIGFAGTMRSAGQYLKIDYPASTASNELQVAVTYTLWIPEAVKTFGVRGAPTSILFRRGVPGARKLGSLPQDALARWLEAELG